MPDIDVAHLAPTPFAQQVALAFLEAQCLGRFHTTLAFPRNSLASKALRGRRVAELIPAEKLRVSPLREIIRLAAGRFNRDPIFTDRIFHWMRDGFERSVIRRGFAGCSAIYAYETQCLRIFRAARENGVKCLLDLPSPEHDYVESLLASERDRFPELQSSFDGYAKALQAERTRNRLEEARLADHIFANSRFTANSWIHAGVDPEKITVLPLGAPDTGSPKPRNRSKDAPFRFLFAGTLDIRKGGHHLLEAWRKGAYGNHAELHVYGSVRLPDQMTGSLPGNVTFHGPRSFSEVIDAMSQADMLAFPTLCDGFGMVIMEALSQGLPVLTTTRAGASDFVRNGQNGWIIETVSAETLAERMSYSIEHPAEIEAMRPAAMNAARERTWPAYRRELVEYGRRSGLITAATGII